MSLRCLFCEVQYTIYLAGLFWSLHKRVYIKYKYLVTSNL